MAFRGYPWRNLCALSLGAAFLLAAASAGAETITIGGNRLAATAPVYIAIDKGYFAAENLTIRVVDFDAAQSIAMGVASGDLDFGATALSSAFYTLAGTGTMKIVAGSVRDAPGFQQYAFVVSNRAYEGGLKSFSDLGGHSVAIVQVGGPIHYTVALLAEKFGIDLKTLRLLPLQGISNEVAAVTGGQADSSVIPATAAMPSVARGDMKLLGITGDAVQWQSGAVFAATATIAQRRALVERVLRAYRKGARDYHDAFAGPDDARRDGPTAPETLAIIAKHVGQPPEQVEQGLPFIDGAARVDIRDIERQITWYRAQEMIKGKFAAADIVDKGLIVPLP